MSLTEKVKQQTSEAMEDAPDVDYITDEYLEELLGGELVEPDWEPDPDVPGEFAAAPQAFCLYYCWNPVRIGSRWYFKWYMGTPPRGSCVNTGSNKVLSHIRWSGARCASGAAIYQIGWWC